MLGSAGQKYVPTDAIGVDFMLVSPQNDTSIRNVYDERLGQARPIQTAFKNVNSHDVSTANFSDSQVLAASLLSIIARECQMITEYFKSPAAQDEKVKYDLSEAQAAIVDIKDTFGTATKAGRPRGATLLRAIRNQFTSSDYENFAKIWRDQNQQQQGPPPQGGGFEPPSTPPQASGWNP